MDSDTEAEERHGLFRLHPPAGNYEPSDCDVDIVAIHGLSGHPLKTWTDKKDHLWLRDSLPGHVPRSRVLTYGYDSALKWSKSRMTLLDFAEDLLYRLKHERTTLVEQKRPLVFVCHSLGGVVVKQALVMASLDDDYGSIASSTSGIAFFGTPHRGSRSADPAKILSRIINVPTFGSAIRTDLLDALQVKSKELDSLSRLFRPIMSRVSVVSFYEQEPIAGRLIVEPFSAVLGIPNERAIPINADHRKITRFSPRHPNKYLPVWASIKELVDKSLLASVGEYEELLETLFCIDYKVAQLRPSQPHSGTCNWIFEHKVFEDWINSPQSAILLLSGPAGCGKTVLTRHIVEEVLAGRQIFQDSSSTNLCASFFCSWNDQALATEESILRSVLHQLLQLNPSAQPLVRNCLLKRTPFREFYDMDSDKLWKALSDVVAMDSMKHAIICIDAIEELNTSVCNKIMAGLHNLVKRFNEGAERSQRKLRVLLSSRPNSQYAVRHQHLRVFQIPKIHIENDIRAYLNHKVSDLAFNNDQFETAIAETGGQEIVDKISSGADGMFMWARVAWEDFSRGYFWDASVVARKLGELELMPSGLNHLYDKTLDRVPLEWRKDMWAVFSTLAIAKRSLSAAELGEAVAVASSNSSQILNPVKLIPFKGLDDFAEKHFPDFIRSHEDGTITLSHGSVREYLLHRAKMDKPGLLERAEASMIRACLGYIKFFDQVQAQNDVKSSSDELPLMSYAFTSCLGHLVSLPVEDPLWLEYANTASSSYYSALSSPIRDILKRAFNWPADMTSTKCQQLVQVFCQAGYDLNMANDPARRGAILNSCYANIRELHQGGSGWQGYLEMIPLLIKLGANVNLYPRGQNSNIKLAILGGVQSVYETVANHPSFDPQVKDSQGRTVLHHVVAMGQTKWALDFLNRTDIDVNIQDTSGSTPLHFAVRTEKQDVVEKLLATYGIRIDLIDADGKTPLTLATYWGLKRIALSFIEQSQAFPLPERDAVHALVLAARHGDKDIVDALLAKTHYRGLSFHMDESGKTLMHIAAAENWADVLVKCLKKSSDININQIDHSGGTALHYAAKYGCTQSCEVLLSYGASACLQNRMGRTAPQEAADAGYKDTLMALVRQTQLLDVNQRDHLGRNLLHWAATFDCPEVMEVLCNIPDAQLTRRDNQGRMPVDYAWVCQCPAVGELLSRKLIANFPDTPTHGYKWEEAYSNAELPPPMRTDSPKPVQLTERESLLKADNEAREARWATGCWALVNIRDVPVASGNAEDEDKGTAGHHVPRNRRAARDDGVPYRPQDSDRRTSPPLSNATDPYDIPRSGDNTAPYDPSYGRREAYAPAYEAVDPRDSDAYYSERDDRYNPESRYRRSPDPSGLYRTGDPRRYSPQPPPPPQAETGSYYERPYEAPPFQQQRHSPQPPSYRSEYYSRTPMQPPPRPEAGPYKVNPYEVPPDHLQSRSRPRPPPSSNDKTPSSGKSRSKRRQY